MSAKEHLDQIARLQWDIRQLEEARDTRIAEILPQDVRALLNHIEVECNTAVEAINKKITELTAKVKDEVVFRGESVKGTSGMIAIFQPGRVTWNSKALDGYALEHPEILALKKEGEPFVTIRKA